MKIIHQNDTVLATVEGDNVSGALEALGLESNQVSVLDVNDAQADWLMKYSWELEGGEVVLAQEFDQPEPPLTANELFVNAVEDADTLDDLKVALLQLFKTEQ